MQSKVQEEGKQPLWDVQGIAPAAERTRGHGWPRVGQGEEEGGEKEAKDG